MIRKEKYKYKVVFICLYVFLCMTIFVFCYFGVDGEKEQNQTEHQDLAVDNTEENLEGKEFAKKNAELILELKEVQNKLIAVFPELSVTSREFNQGLAAVIELLQKTEDDLIENWEQFQNDFAYEYDKMNKYGKSRRELPKEVGESERKIMRILQELNQVIQQMHK